MDQKHMPPIPPKNRSPKGAGSEPKLDNPVSEEPENIDQVGDRGNVRQNTSNQQKNR
jgi:hypothetical protein